MQQACLLLDTTDMKINQICYKIGIEDTYYFPAYSVRSWECHRGNIVNQKRLTKVGGNFQLSSFGKEGELWVVQTFSQPI